MGVSTINAKMVKNAFLAGAKGLSDKKEWINELNVFPVPDGDTGTNMTLTIMAAAKEVAALNDPSMEQLAKAISSGSLRGARGNSGVILSQLLRGFTKEIQNVDPYCLCHLRCHYWNGDGKKSIIPVSNRPNLAEPAVCTAGSAAFLFNFQFYC